jgi:ABC-type transport system involved in multi-copper enzyme maturation permease subunit
MKYLLKIEWRKHAKNPIFWVVLGLYILSITVELFGAEAFINRVTSNASKNSPIPIPSLSIYVFPYVWHSLTYLAGFLKPLLAFVVILFITNEFTFRTIRQHLINGLSREEVFLTKFIFILALSIISAIVVSICVFILGIVHTNDLQFEMIATKSGFLWAYFLEVFGICSFALMISILLKRSGLAIVVFSVYFFIVEPVLGFKLNENIAKYLPLKTFGRLIDVPNTGLMKLFGVNFREFIEPMDVLLSIFYSFIFLLITYLVIKKRDA